MGSQSGASPSSSSKSEPFEYGELCPLPTEETSLLTPASLSCPIKASLSCSSKNVRKRLQVAIPQGRMAWERM